MGHLNPLATDLLGRVIDGGRLRLVDVLGSGSSGSVMLAREQSGSSNPRTYAVKCLTRAPAGTPKYESQWREICHHRAMSSHPNVVTLHNVLEENDCIFLVMEYCPGGDLFDFLSDGKSFCGNVKQIKSVFLQILDALEACHQAGIYHRDVKPENIFCSADGSKVYLGDFGLSTTNSYSRNFGVGSFSYMSPECIHYDVTLDAYSTRRTDIWALGSILTLMISGRHPWRMAATVDESFKAYMRDPNHLAKMLPISEGANLMLRHIFTRKEKNRVSLEYLRQLVYQLDTFFMSSEEIMQACPQLQSIAASYFRKSRQHRQLRPFYHETQTSYGVELGHLDGRRASGRKSSADAIPPSHIVLRPPQSPMELGIRQIPRSAPTNPPSDLSDGLSGSVVPDLRLPILPPKAHCAPRFQRGTMKASNGVSAADQMKALGLGLVNRGVDRVVD